MADMMSFFTWLLEQTADFLWTEPIKYFTVIIFGFCILSFFRSMLNLR